MSSAPREHTIRKSVLTASNDAGTYPKRHRKHNVLLLKFEHEIVDLRTVSPVCESNPRQSQHRLDAFAPWMGLACTLMLARILWSVSWSQPDFG